MKKPKILVVDDEQDIREVLAWYMESIGAEVFQVPTGFDAAIVASVHADMDLMLLDLSMPVMGGWAALEEIRKYEGMAELPVIVITAHSVEEQKKAGADLKVEAIMGKPFAEEELIATVKKALIKRGYSFES
jgi:two-component system OmpR family response regulator